MIMSIKKGITEYQLNFDRMTQLCGCDLIVKNYIINSICKHFSSEKYKEYESHMIDNIIIDGQISGRKQWECYRLSDEKDIVNAIKLNKTSMLWKCINRHLENYDCQNDLLIIDEVLCKIFSELNNSILKEQEIELQYCTEDILSIVQQCDIKTLDGKDIHELTTLELIDNMLEIVVKYQHVFPEKRLYIFENIDHIVSKTEYQEIAKKCEDISYNTGARFLFSTSLDGYVYLSEEVFETINIANNNEVVALADYEHFYSYISCNYPIEKKWSKDDTLGVIKDIIHKIGADDLLIDLKSQVILKMINGTYGIKTKLDEVPKTPEINYLLD